MHWKTASFVVLMFALSPLVLAQKNEVSLSAGALATSDQQAFACFINLPTCIGPINAHFSTSVALEANYVRQIFNFRVASLGVEFPMVGVPRQDVTTTFNGIILAAHQSSFFFTPSARIKFLPSGAVSPFLSLGGGLAHHESAGSVTGGALQFGGGVDFKTPLPHLGVRAEVRDFWASGLQESSSFLRITPERQHNLFAGAGLVIRF